MIRSLSLFLGSVSLASLAACSLPSAPTPAEHPAQLRGTVSGLPGASFGLGGATVWAGAAQTRSAEPSGGLSPDREFADPRNADKPLSVWHVFQPGEKPQLTERVPLKHPRGPEPGDRYVYLRRGEFFFEALPEGPLSLRAEKYGVSSEPLVVQLAPGLRLEAQHLSVPLPTLTEDRSAVAWTALAPTSGFTVQTGQEARFLDASSEARISLRGLPGWPGGSVSELDVHLGGQGPGQNETSDISYRLPLEAPLFLGPCPGDGYGPQVDVSFDLDTPALREFLQAPQPPTFLVAKVRFLQSDGTPLPGEQGPLEAHIPLRCF